MSGPEFQKPNPDLSQHRLDIVRDCSDLAGSFPQNVTLKFIFWEHGSLDADPDSLDYAGIARAAKGADLITEEVVFAVEGESGEDVEQEFRELSGAVRGLNDLPENNTSTAMCVLYTAIALLDLGVPKSEMPAFVPVDTYAEATTISDIASFAEYMRNPTDEALYQQVSKLRHREATVIRQLHYYATHLAVDGEDHTIAIVHGARHSLMSVAAGTLGAKVSRIFLASIVDTNLEVTEREFRLSGLSSDNMPNGSITKDCNKPTQHATTIGEKTHDIYKSLFGTSYSFDAYYDHRVEPFARRAANGKITTAQEKIWEKYQSTADSFLAKGKLGKRLARGAMLEVLKEYEAMLEQEAARQPHITRKH